MGKHHGYVYLELDGLELWFNPFPDLNAGWLAAQKSKALKVSLIGGKIECVLKHMFYRECHMKM